MNTQIAFILIALFGALCQEILHWYELRNKLDEEENKKLLRSGYYWAITIMMMVVSAAGTWLIFYDYKGTTFPPKIPFVLGAAFPIVFKKLVAAFQSRDLGTVSKSSAYKFDDISKIYFQ